MLTILFKLLNDVVDAGFCYFNNVAVAAKYATSSGKSSRVFILDWDIHHGSCSCLTVSSKFHGIPYLIVLLSYSSSF